jgi:hypothetical protein
MPDIYLRIDLSILRGITVLSVLINERNSHWNNTYTSVQMYVLFQWAIEIIKPYYSNGSLESARRIGWTCGHWWARREQRNSVRSAIGFNDSSLYGGGDKSCSWSSRPCLLLVRPWRVSYEHKWRLRPGAADHSAGGADAVGDLSSMLPDELWSGC